MVPLFIHLSNNTHIAIEYILLIIVLYLHYLSPIRKRSAEWVSHWDSGLLATIVQMVYPCITSSQRCKHLNILYRVIPKTFGDSLLNNMQQCLQSSLTLTPANKKEITTIKFWKQALIILWALVIIPLGQIGEISFLTVSPEIPGLQRSRGHFPGPQKEVCPHHR
jgi:hypothetical protein